MKDVLFDAELDGSSVCVEFTSPKFGSFYQAWIKRGFDLVFAILLLPIVVPLVLLLWLPIQLSGGRALYKQDRVGRGGKTFRCLKLRTMHQNAEQSLEELCKKDAAIAAEWHENQKLAEDPRITRIGKFLRATSLDELPQIWNVLRGDMSFVGPRPFLKTQDLTYRAAGGVSYYRMRPGITGLWQVSGRGGTAFVERVKFDEEYARRVTLLGDLKLIVNTAHVIVEQTGQ